MYLATDRAYAQAYWDSRLDESHSRYNMAHHISVCLESGRIGFLVSAPKLSEEDKQRMSACRWMAADMGFLVGSFRRVDGDQMVAIIS